MSEAKRDPKLAAVEAELASDRGDVYDPDENRHEVHRLKVSGEDVGKLIEEAKAREVDPKRRGKRPHWFTSLTFGLWKPKAAPRKDYRYEFDPNTGNQRRVYTVRDGKKK